jgi:hypothetical protein
MNKKEINEICNYIKDNPKAIIEYCGGTNFLIFKDIKMYNKVGKIIEDCWDLDVCDETEGYTPFIALIFLECAKKKIDISQIKIKSC